MSTPCGSQSAVVITCSDSVMLGRAEDRSGPLAAALLAELGWRPSEPVTVPDEQAVIADAITAAVATGARIIVTTGGTGLGPRDVTIEALSGLGAREIPGLGEAMRAAARERLPAADLSRSGGFTLGRALVLCLPGSSGGVRDGLAAVGGLLGHAIDMLDGGAHGGHGGHGGHGSHGGTELGGESAAQNGAHKPFTHAFVQSEPLDLSLLTAAVAADDAGAVVTFEGRVRDHDAGRNVVGLHYSAHPDAGRVLSGAVRDLVESQTGIRAAAAHRVGDLDIGDLAFAVAVSAAHRGAAFAACADLVDEVKRILPVWKLQRFDDGEQEWVNCA